MSDSSAQTLKPSCTSPFFLATLFAPAVVIGIAIDAVDAAVAVSPLPIFEPVDCALMPVVTEIGVPPTVCAAARTFPTDPQKPKNLLNTAKLLCCCVD